MKGICLVILCLVTFVTSKSSFSLLKSWRRGFKGKLCLTNHEKITCGWKAVVVFKPQIDQLKIVGTRILRRKELNSKKVKFVFMNKKWKTKLEEGDEMCLTVFGKQKNKKGKITLKKVFAKFIKICNNENTTKKPKTPRPEMTTPTRELTTTSGKQTATSPEQTTTAAKKTTSSAKQTTSTTKQTITMAKQTTTMAKQTTTTPKQTTVTLEQTTSKPGSQAKYNFSEILDLSILFYEAQRSGMLPENNRVPWRGDSALGDKGDKNEDLTGGWYDAGDKIKFSFPMSTAVTWLNWGFLKWTDSYKAAGQLDHMYNSIKWPLNYFLKCWNSTTQEFYVQVSNAENDHSVWVRPEDMTMPRPPYKVTPSAPGSDVAGQTAAAMASGSIAFKIKDPQYSTELLSAAESLYLFGKNNKGKYSDSVAEARDYYGSSGYNDDLALAAMWLYKATNNSGYLTDADQLVPTWKPWALDWDDKSAAVQLMLFEATGDTKYRDRVKTFVDDYLPGGTVPYTNCGLAFRNAWGVFRYTANVAMLALMAAEDGIRTHEYQPWALGQIYYMLGDNKYGRSYVVGFGNNYPLRPHHAGASCPSVPNLCDWSYLSTKNPNPHILKGALVGGPDEGDNYDDNRENYIRNEVTCDYNAGFQSAIAGLLHLERNNKLPNSTLKGC